MNKKILIISLAILIVILVGDNIFSSKEKMEEIKLINRAKWALINSLGMTEADAHRYIEKQAMDRCVARREIAENIIQTYK